MKMQVRYTAMDSEQEDSVYSFFLLFLNVYTFLKRG